MNGNTDDVMTLRSREIEETFLLSINKGYGHYIWTIRSQRDINSEKTNLKETYNVMTLRSYMNLKKIFNFLSAGVLVTKFNKIILDRSQWINNDLNASDDVMIVISRVLNNSLNKYYGHHI